MNSIPNYVETCVEIFEKRGKDALEKTKTALLESKYDGGQVSSALKYFAQTTLRGALPVFPALVSLSCEAVGGDPKKTVGVGAALSLIAAAADVHDDIIDKSTAKYSKKTVYGKYGAAVGLLVGDALLIQGLTLLQRECETLPEEQKLEIQNLVTEAFYEISKAEAKAANLRGKLDIAPQKYLEIINLRSVVPKVHFKIGAILGNADNSTVIKMGKIGETFGFLSLIVEEFADLFDLDELQNRIANECPPLPLLQALENPHIATEIIRTLSEPNLSKVKLRQVAQFVLGSEEAKKLFEVMNSKAHSELLLLSFIKNKKMKGELSTVIMEPIASLRNSLQSRSRL
jgi:geranylgeranyl pyrophosphate synthase